MTTPIDEAAKALNDEHRKIWPGAGFFAKPEALQIAQAVIQAHTAAVLRGTEAEKASAHVREAASLLRNIGSLESEDRLIAAEQIISAQAAALAVERGKVAELEERLAAAAKITIRKVERKPFAYDDDALPTPPTPAPLGEVK